MFESISNFFGKAKAFFGSVYDTVSEKVSTIYHGIVDTGKEVVTTIHQDLRDVASGYKEVVTGVVKTGGDVITHGEDVVGDVGKSFSLPLALAGGAIGLYFLSKN